MLNVLAVANIPRSVYRNRPVQAFASSALTIMCLVALFGICLCSRTWSPPATTRPDSLTVYNAASSTGTLWTMFIIVLIGMPFVLAYTTAVYWTFRGRVELGEHSY